MINRLWCFVREKKHDEAVGNINDFLNNYYVLGIGIGHLNALSHLILTLILQLVIVPENGKMEILSNAAYN